MARLVRTTRREWLRTARSCALLLGPGGALAACAARQAARHEAVYLELDRTPTAQGTRVLAFLPDTPQTREVWRALCDELGAAYQLIAVRISAASDVPIVAQALARNQPSALVLMNNTSLAAYGQYQRAHPGMAFPPAVAVMSSFLEGQSRGMSGLTGISYEVPLITAVTHLRKVIATPVDRVGVVHRGFLSDFIAQQAKLAQVEQVHVVREQVSERPNASELKRALRRLKQQVDALWVLNDDQLLTPRLIVDGWLPGMNERPFVPAIVGAASLVSAETAFGTFAVLPDHAALGVQAADLLFELADNAWTLPEGSRVQLPLSTNTTIDLAHARERFALRDDALAQVDCILK